MTTLLDEGEALVVRCDDCRRLWPVTRTRLAAPPWHMDEERDLHLCPVCMCPDLDAPAATGQRPGLAAPR